MISNPTDKGNAVAEPPERTSTYKVEEPEAETSHALSSTVPAVATSQSPDARIHKSEYIKWIYIIITILLLAIIGWFVYQKYFVFCTDSDGGIDFFTNGITESRLKGWSGKVQDYCTAGNLREFYCDDSGRYVDKDISCASIGLSCIDGRCQNVTDVCCQINGTSFRLPNSSTFDYCNALGGMSVEDEYCMSNITYCFEFNGAETSKFVIENMTVWENVCDEERAFYKTRLRNMICNYKYYQYGEVSMYGVDCPYGCMNGACLDPCWNCSEWTGCVNREQNRTCTASTNCSKVIDKPSEIRECSEGAYSWRKVIPLTTSPASCEGLCAAQGECPGEGNDDNKYCRKTDTIFGYPRVFFFDSCTGGSVNGEDINSFYCCCKNT